VSGRLATAEERQLLELSDAEYVLALLGVSMTDSGLPVEVTVMTVLAEGRHLCYRLFI